MFRTQVVIPKSSLKINYKDYVMSLGSCFSENIGKKMTEVYFQSDVNPFGVIYNPISISNSINLILQNKQFSEKDLFENRSLWQSFSHSSLFSDSSIEGCLEKINSRLDNSIKFLHKTNVLIITFGTAWVFQLEKSGMVVSNCHKLPSSEFKRKRLSVEEIVGGYKMLIQKLQTTLPNLHIIFSVSPIRHWKDGAHENNISKSILLVAIDELINLFSKVHYFPAYEIQIDELRDYRFYASDMLHPSQVAVDYIWQRFNETYFDDQTRQLKSRLEQLSADLAHRPFQPDSLEYKKFQENTEKRKAEIRSEFPFLSNRIK